MALFSADSGCSPSVLSTFFKSDGLSRKYILTAINGHSERHLIPLVQTLSVGDFARSMKSSIGLPTSYQLAPCRDATEVDVVEHRGEDSGDAGAKLIATLEKCVTQGSRSEDPDPLLHLMGVMAPTPTMIDS